MNAILKLEKQDQDYIIDKISRTRQKKLLEYLNELPYLDDEF